MPGPVVDVGKLIAKEIRTIGRVVLKISLSQVSCIICANFVFSCVLTSFFANSNKNKNNEKKDVPRAQTTFNRHLGLFHVSLVVIPVHVVYL